VKKEEIRARIEQLGIVPAVRVSSADHARYAAETVCRSGIPIAEIIMMVPGALEVIGDLAKNVFEMIVGAGTVLDTDMAQRCVDVGAQFLTSMGFVCEVVEFSVQRAMLFVSGALTLIEVIQAWQAGSDMIKIFPCGQVGGPSYIHALKVPFPQVPLIAAGGVNQQTALDYMLAGATALGIGGELIPKEALQRKQDHRIRELARRFLTTVKDARRRMAAS